MTAQVAGPDLSLVVITVTLFELYPHHCCICSNIDSSSLCSFYCAFCGVWCVIRCIWSSTDNLLNHVVMHLSSLTMREICMVSYLLNFSHFAVFVIVWVKGRWL